MKSTLTKDQISTYRNDGVVVHRNLLNEDEVGVLKEAVLSSVESLGKNKVAGSDDDRVEKEDYYSKVFTQRLNLWRINETIKGFMLGPGIGKMITDLEGVDGFRVWHERIGICF
jgi:phytanoyl-CoA hydroxylase